MDWVMVLMGIVAIVVAVVSFVMFTAGEVVGSVLAVVSTPLLSDRELRFVVKRIEPSGSRRQPVVTLQARVFGGVTMTRFNAAEAKAMAAALDEMVEGKDPKVKQFKGHRLEFIPGREIGVHVDIGDRDKTARLDYADAHQLAKLLRTAAA